MVISVPFASLRTSPIDFVVGQEPDVEDSKDKFGRAYDLYMTLKPGLRDVGQRSQLLYGECVICLERLDNGFLKVELPEQYGVNHGTYCLEHSVGYIKENEAQLINSFPTPTHVINKDWAAIELDDGSMELPMGTKLCLTSKSSNVYTVTLVDGRVGTINAEAVYQIQKQVAETEDQLRESIVLCAKKLIGGPYCWAGRSPDAVPGTHCMPSSNCTGLINLAYRACGLELSRRLLGMFLRSAKIEKGSQLKPGDLIFFEEPNQSDGLNHVLMYAGDNMIIESCVQKGIFMRPSQEVFGKPVATLCAGDTITNTAYKNLIYFGSYLGDTLRIQFMRDYALGNCDVTRWVKDEHNQLNITGR